MEKKSIHPGGDISVFRLGDNIKVFNVKRPENKNIIPNNYLLSVGTFEARKNRILMYYVYKLAKSRNIMLPKIVIVGRLGWRSDDIYNILKEDPDTKDNFIFMQNANDEELEWLYKNCLFTVYPSFYEGWGLPIAESVQRGKMVCASNTSSMPEIAGDLISYFNPYSTDECLNAITKLLNSDKLKESNARLGRYVPTEWDSTYNQFLKIIGDRKK
jgi:glycosyltransferase involved in cell wall biosynthesis